MVVSSRVRLLDQGPLFRPVPMAAPSVVRPGKAEGEIWFARCDDLIKWPLKQTSPGKPIVPVAERFDAGGASELGLGSPDLRDPQVVEAQVGGEVRLIVARKQGLCL